VAPHCRRRRRSLFEPAIESLDEMPQLADRVLETAQAIAHLDERDDEEEDDRPEKDH
jgi:hypothetical protein